MDEFRIMLLILGVFIIIGIYLWGVGFNEKKFFSKLKRLLKHKTHTKFSKKHNSDHFAEKTNQDMNPADALLINPREEEFDYSDVFRNEGGLRTTEKSDASESTEVEPELVVLYVTAREQAGFNGGDIRDTLYAAGMGFGEMQIFHHYGLGQAVSEKSIFSLANIMEPGTFDLENIQQMYTKGVVLFMQLPNPIDPAIAYEHMLSTAQRLADVNQGQVRDKQQKPLTSEAVEKMRAYVAGFRKDNQNIDPGEPLSSHLPR